MTPPTDLVAAIQREMEQRICFQDGHILSSFQAKDRMVMCTTCAATLAAAWVGPLEAALERCNDLFYDIRGDWTDPRSECREGWEAIRTALTALPWQKETR